MQSVMATRPRRYEAAVLSRFDGMSLPDLLAMADLYAVWDRWVVRVSDRPSLLDLGRAADGDRWLLQMGARPDGGENKI
ncbi:hypothetical protein ACLOJK_006418 [Asimina triloba]